jgi:hypothetical protein
VIDFFRMPPKKVNTGEQKALQKKKDKVAEDKTFGLKNKNKSKAVQKYIASVKQQVKTPHGAKPVTEHEQRQEKKKESERAKLLNSLFGNLGILETKKKKKKEDDKGKIDLYVDQRDQAGASGDNKEQDTMADWDQEKLEKVVGQRHGAQAKQCQTDIICKFFLDAVEKGLYGWFWVCPNGGDTCKYRHSLPPGYVLKKNVPVDEEDEEEEISLEEQIEIERAALPAGGTAVTQETFKKWLIDRANRKREAAEQEKQAIIDAASKKGQKVPFGLSGRDLFTFDPNLFVDDDGAADQQLYADMEESNEVFDEELFEDGDIDIEDSDVESDEDEEDDDVMEAIEEEELEEDSDEDEHEIADDHVPHKRAPEIATD